MRWWLICGLAAACAGEPEDAVPAELTLTFAVTEGVRASPNLVDPLLGDVYGSIFRRAEVTATGPREDAVEVASVQVEAVDLREVEESAQAWVGALPPPDLYVFLGFMDVDGNGAEDPDPDNGDLVPLATTNDFTTVQGEALSVVVQFELVYNFD